MKVLYILNESCFYMRLAWFSLTTLRKYNPDIPVEILFICDNKRDNRFLGRLEKLDMGIPWFNKTMFFEECKHLRVQLNIVENIEMGEEKGFHSSQRKEFVRVEGEQILLLDADTFIFDDISCLFDGLKDYDVIIDQNEWSNFGNRFPFMGKYQRPFNSGVVLFGKGLLQEYGKQVFDLCVAIKHERHPVGKWLGEYESDKNIVIPKLSREEFALTVFILENKINFRFFKPHEVQTGKLTGRARIYHSMTQYWPAAWQKFFKNGVFKPPFFYRPKSFIKFKRDQ